MKRLLLTILLFAGSYLFVTSQSVFWEDDFENPDGWIYEGNWNIGNGMLLFNWDPIIYQFDHSAVSGPITIDNFVTDLTVKQYLSIYNTSGTERAEILVKTENEEFLLWEYDISSGNWGSQSGTDLSFSLEDFAGETIQLKFRTYGETTFNWTWWQIFDVKIEAEYSYDLAISQIDGPNNLELNQTGDWIIEVVNQGSDPLNFYQVHLLDSKSGNILTTIDENNTLEAGETRLHFLPWTSQASFNTILYGYIESPEDQFTGNNFSGGQFLRVEPDFDYNILIWGNDNGIQSILCPEKGDMITATTGLKRIFDDSGIDYDFTYVLPDDLYSYDIVYVTMGSYCLT